MTVSVQTPAVELACQLIRQHSVTPEDGGCQLIIGSRLEKIGFALEPMPFGNVSNLWARRGKSAPLFVFAGHTDVVPPGPETEWKYAPFSAATESGNLYGRGAADMKSAIAAMIVAVENFIAKHPNHRGSLGFLITSDEEGDAVNGTVKVIQRLQERAEHIDFCIVGESTCSDTVGDTIKNGRRGSLTGKLRVLGTQGHVAYPERSENPIHRFAPALAELCAQSWDAGNDFFSPTTMQVSNLNSGTGADNVIPGDLSAIFNFRFSSEVTAEELKVRTHKILDGFNLRYELQWRHSGNPFLTRPGTLTEATDEAIKAVQGIQTQYSTTGGTSDARFIAPTGAQVIELGLINATIHKINEHVRTADIDTLQAIYELILEKLVL